MRLLRLLRGTIGTAIIWAVGWALAGTILRLTQATVFGALGLDAGIFTRLALIGGLFYAISGAFAGGLFAMLMAVNERRRTFSDLSTRRVVAWGTLAGLSYPVLWFTVRTVTFGSAPIGGLLFSFILPAALGAASAWGMLSLARRSNPPDPLMLDTARPSEWSPSESIHENQTTRS